MNTDSVKYLYNQYLKRRLSPSELLELKRLLAAEDQQSVFKDLIDSDWEKLDQDLSVHFPDNSKARILREIYSKTGRSTPSLKLWKYIAACAAAIVLIFTTIYLTNERQGYGHIIPGKKGGTLTLASGKVISLAETRTGEILKQGGVTVTKMADGQVIYDASGTSPLPETGGPGIASQINTLRTSKGETYILTLPDKSKVWLNAASSIRFPTQFSKSNRKVTLIGEGYFEISKDPLRPFLVESAEQTVEVLGTHFNVSAYEDEQTIKTTLLEGSVKIIAKSGHKQVIKPNQEAITNGKTIMVSAADPEMAVDWKNGYFIFKDEDFKTAMRKIERWYDVEIVYDADVSIDLEPGGWISRNSDIRTLLNRIEATSGIHFKLEGRRIRVTK